MFVMSREQLYDLVWAKPMSDIAREHGVRDQHIARACDMFDIARPPAGYWQKISHGKVCARSDLSARRFAPGAVVTIKSVGQRMAYEIGKAKTHATQVEYLP